MTHEDIQELIGEIKELKEAIKYNTTQQRISLDRVCEELSNLRRQQGGIDYEHI